MPSGSAAAILSLDLMRRFGENLLSAVEYLEQEGVAHRDVKPDNIGIAKVAGTGPYRLVLFKARKWEAPREKGALAAGPIGAQGGGAP